MGGPVSVRMTKWGERPHWAFTGRYLGADDHGDWLGFPAGTEFRRPGARFVAPVDQVSLVPRDGARFIATFHAPGARMLVYVDLTLPGSWEDTGAGLVLRAVDMDLDVVRLPDGSTYVDDEAEFEAHRVEFGYPDDVVATVRAECDALLAAVTALAPPFHGVAHTWLAQLP